MPSAVNCTRPFAKSCASAFAGLTETDCRRRGPLLPHPPTKNSIPMRRSVETILNRLITPPFPDRLVGNVNHILAK